MENIYIKEKKISFQDFFDQDDDMKVMKIKNDNSRLKRLNNFLHNYLSHNVLKKLPLNKSQDTPKSNLVRDMNILNGSVRILLCASGQVEIAMK